MRLHLVLWVKVQYLDGHPFTGLHVLCSDDRGRCAARNMERHRIFSHVSGAHNGKYELSQSLIRVPFRRLGGLTAEHQLTTPRIIRLESTLTLIPHNETCYQSECFATTATCHSLSCDHLQPFASRSPCDLRHGPNHRPTQRPALLPTSSAFL